MEVRREDEFSPLKNAKGTGQDDEDTSRAAVLSQGEKWAKAAGATVVNDGGLEISPLISYGGEGLEKLSGKTIQAPAIVELD
ncbi:hypothetical protein NLG97_g11307 [Lecanicillium saksenae]|uniref:Uncharacterized protein n=1 Tax=Lecanicillium saksenae TaxID=468837 RepID=A0ACC1QAX2_9HYPO|nr:hypothetical protein NLG97_g11307 [Lecanicillium saksenae]